MADVTAEALEQVVGQALDADVTVTDLEEHVEGWSRDTVSFTASWTDADGDHERRLVVRAESDEQVEGERRSEGNDIETEYRTMDAVQDAAVPVPETICFEDDRSVMGGKCFVVGHCPGEAPIVWDRNDREDLYAHWDGDSDLPTQFVDALAGIHELEPGDVPFLETHEDYVGWEIDRWESIYRDAAPKTEPAVEEAIRWFRANKPEVPEHTLVHGDYRVGNMLLAEGDLSAVLDWELARVGDPMYDLGYASTRYFAGKLITPIERPELACSLLEREWFYDEYERRTGRPVDRERVRYWQAFSAFVMMTISLSGVARFREGTANDVRSAWFQYTVPGLIEDQLEIIRPDRTVASD
jgi:aminoglycoside phosphotransferase (APT) family kinase protein